MDEDMTRKISNIRTPPDNEAEIEKYENSVMDIKNQTVSYVTISINTHAFWLCHWMK